MWVVMAAWGYVGSGSLQLWYVVPCLALVSIFQGSTWITEKISCSKYPLYK